VEGDDLRTARQGRRDDRRLTMELRPLGSTGLRVSAISLGAMNFGGRTDADTAATMLHAALDAGVNLVDTADLYHAGTSEEIVGDLLARSGRRDEVLVATKCGMDVGPTANDRGASRRHIVASCERSLRRLRTDRIDLYQLHRPFFEVAPEETLGAFDQLVRAGKVIDIGSSTHPAWFLMECLSVSERERTVRYVSEQPPYNLLDRRAENELVPLCQRHGLAILPWSPLAGGILSGRYTSPTEVPADSRAATLPAMRDRVTGAALRVTAELATLAADAGLTPGQLALVWLRDQPGVTSPIVGPRTPEQLSECLAAAIHEPLDSELLERIDALVPPGEHVADFHNSSRWTGGKARL
jgi:1-deoxyxylulose-5-phosphate synthase